MRTTTAAFDTARVKTGLRVAYLVELGATPLYLSDKALSDGTNSYTADVVSFEGMSASNDRRSGGAIADRAGLTLRYTAALMTAAKPGAAVTIYLWFVGESLAAADRLAIFSGTVAEPVRQTRQTIELRLEGDAVNKNAVIGDILTTSEYADADPADVGTVKPILFGDVKGSVCQAIDAGAVSTLAEDIDDTVTSAELTDAARYPTSGTIQIQQEQITYTGKSGNQLTGFTRGAGGTTAVAHDAGTTVGEVQTAYTYLIADHAITTVDEVYVDRVRQLDEGSSTLSSTIDAVVTSLTVADATGWPAFGDVIVDSERMHYASITTNTLNGLTRGTNGTTAAGHTAAATVTVYDHQIKINDSGQAKLVFATSPILAKSGTIDVNDTIGVSDTIAVTATTTANLTGNDATTSSTPWTQTANSLLTKSFTSRTITGSTVYLAYEVYVTNTVFQSGDLVTIKVKGTGQSTGSYITIYEYYYDGSTLWVSKGSAAPIASNDNQIHCQVNKSSSINAATARFVSLTRSYNEVGAVTPTKTGTASKTGSVTLTGTAAASVIGAQVSVDCTGYDTQRPDEIIEQALLTYGNGIVAGDLDTTVTDSAAVYSTNYDLAVRIDRPTDLMVLCREIAYQAASRFFWDSGLAYLVKFPTTSSSVDQALTQADLYFDDYEIGYTPYREIMNEITARYDNRSDVDDYLASVSASVAASQTLYGVRDVSSDFLLSHVNNSTSATNVVADYQTRYAYPKLTARISMPLSRCNLQRGDVVTVDYAAGGFDVLVKWEVMTQSTRPGRVGLMDVIELELEAITETLN